MKRILRDKRIPSDRAIERVHELVERQGMKQEDAEVQTDREYNYRYGEMHDYFNKKAPTANGNRRRIVPPPHWLDRWEMDH